MTTPPHTSPDPPAWVTGSEREQVAVELETAARRAMSGTNDALAHATLAHVGGRRREARAWADLTVSGCVAWELFRAAPPQDEQIHAAARALSADVLRLELLSMATDAVLSRAYTTAWRLRHGAVREQQDWIAVCPTIDAPHRRQLGVGHHAQHDLKLQDTNNGQAVHARFAILDEANTPWRVDAEDRAIDRVLPRERAPVLTREAAVVVHLAGSAAGLDEVEDLAEDAAARGIVIIAVDGPGAGTTHVCSDASALLRPWAGLERDVVTALSATLGHDVSAQVIAMGDARTLMAAPAVVDIRDASTVSPRPIAEILPTR